MGAQGGNAADSAAALPTQEALVAAVGRALATLKANCSFDEFVTGTRTMLTFVGNCVKEPGNPKCAFHPTTHPGVNPTLTRSFPKSIVVCESTGWRQGGLNRPEVKRGVCCSNLNS
jgi:hypothetical protein